MVACVFVPNHCHPTLDCTPSRLELPGRLSGATFRFTILSYSQIRKQRCRGQEENIAQAPWRVVLSENHQPVAPSPYRLSAELPRGPAFVTGQLNLLPPPGS